MGDEAKRSPLVKLLKLVQDHLKDGLNFDSLVATNKTLLDHYLPQQLATALHYVLCWFLAHVQIFIALVSPIAAKLPQQRGNWKLSDAFSFCQTELTIMLLALSAFFHLYSIPAFIRPFNWAFTLRPQINVKPKMTMVAKKSQSDFAVAASPSAADTLSSTKSKSLGNLADIHDCNTEIDFGLSLKVRDGITDKIMTFTERAIDTYTIASTLSARTIDSDANSLAGSDFGFDASELNDEDLSPYDQENFLNEHILLDRFLEGPDFQNGEEKWESEEKSEADA